MQKLQLSIPEPCHENWQNMTATEQGRFCNACAKEVVDFSTMTDIQVLNYFTNMTQEKVCGRALPEQLDRVISRPEPPKKKLFWYWNYIVMFFMLFKGNNAAAQNSTKSPTEASSAVGGLKITDEQLNQIKATNVNNALAGRVGQTVVNASRVINGKVTDVNGNPIPFASIKIKGTNNGVIADANGVYSLKVKADLILEISAQSFKTLEVPVSTQTVINITLENNGKAIGEVVFRAGMVRRVLRTPTTNEVEACMVKPILPFQVKEDKTGILIEDAFITVVRKTDLKSDTATNEQKGNYTYSKLKDGESYFIKVEAPGYESNEFTIEGKEIKDRKKPWEVLLKKKETDVRIRGLMLYNSGINKSPIYVIDGTIMPQNSKNDIKSDDVDHIEVLQGSAAAALFGPEGANGAIIITTRKAKEIKMKEVVVTSAYYKKGALRTQGAVSYTTACKKSFVSDTIANIKNLLTGSIKIYPNPVQRNDEFSVQLKLKQPGNNYSMIISDAAGKMLLQQQFNAAAKDHTEKLTGDRRWAAGIYYIRIFDPQNKLISKSSFIFQ